MSRTTVEYNGITIYGCQTLECRETAVRDTTGVDVLRHQFNLRFMGMVHTSNHDIHGFSKTGDDVSANVIAIRRALMEDRKKFTWTVGDTPILQVDPIETKPETLENRDVDQGPKPQEFTIRKVLGQQVLEVEFSIQISLIDCDGTNVSGVVSNRWGVSDVIDRDFYTTRTFQGELVIASPLLQDIGAHYFRPWVVPPLEKGFYRDRMEFTANPNGVTFLYTIVDIQTSHAPPPPATTWDGTHEVSVSRDAGAIGTSISVSVRLRGPEGVTKAQLFAAASAVFRDRTLYETGSSVAVLQNCAFIDTLHENQVELRARIWKGGQVISDLAALDQTRIGKPLEIPGYNRLQSQEASPFGTALVTGLKAVFAQSPCSETHSIQEVGQGQVNVDRSKPSGNVGVKVETYQGVGSFNPDNGPYDSKHITQAVYTFYRIEARMARDERRHFLPIAKSSDSDDETTTLAASYAKPGMRRVVKVMAERTGAWPELPVGMDYEENGIKYWFDKSTFVSQVPEYSADGDKKDYSVSLQYEYAMSKPLGSEGLRTGSLPWDTTELAQNLLPTGVFSNKIA